MKINLTFGGQMGQCNPIKYISLLSERENTVLQWEFKLKCAMATAKLTARLTTLGTCIGALITLRRGTSLDAM
jgi:hypothetical protein